MKILVFMELIVFIFVVYSCLFGILNRLCRCIEHCSTAKTEQTKIQLEASNKVYPFGVDLSQDVDWSEYLEDQSKVNENGREG